MYDVPLTRYVLYVFTYCNESGTRRVLDCPLRRQRRMGVRDRISTATISRINRCIQYGSGGYRETIEKVRGTQNPKKQK